ncbi:hypothetical protein OM076_26545 [Solirubrobacter ginsenosidimutans]|uniref:Uncharacterized protein n=1 Tax=Solirubrobacter ginsenosidimutans TaxID=490573 RepID=A0A9X3S7X4_9ACTN|nr:hypothetical protein [Solirubrobacter ginsenosidimutans]MDA0163858.1 hypothetical protein [Solirubrobacter ginsenosidimutans]
MRRTLVLAAFGLAVLAPAAHAQQAGSTAPPGNSAIDEYVETVPGATGNRSPRPPGQAPSPALTRPQRAALEREGEVGEQLAQLIDETAPPAPAPGKPAAKRSTPATGTATTPPVTTPVAGAATTALTVADERATSPVKATLAAAIGPNDAGGLGIFFPVILVASLVGMIALTLRRRRLPM